MAALVGEEIFDSVQRATLHDPELQPLVRQVMRIHVTEEARHIRYAREDLARRMAAASWPSRQFARFVAGIGALLLRTVLMRPEVYARAGLDRRAARKAARRNQHIRATWSESLEKLRAFLHDQGVIGGPSRVFWHLARIHPDGKPA